MKNTIKKMEEKKSYFQIHKSERRIVSYSTIKQFPGHRNPPPPPAPPSTDRNPIIFANWLAKNFWVCHGRIGDDATWNHEPPGTQWGEGEQKTTTELFVIFKNEMEGNKE